MVQLISPAPYASTDKGLEFGNTTVKPYSPSRPHGGKDHKWSIARVAKSRQVHAPVTGKVVRVLSNGANNNGWGNYVDIEVIPGIFVRLAHLLSGSIRVKAGDRITVGDRVGTMGATGETGGKVHLHEELWIHGKRVDPDLYRGPNGRHLPGTEPKPAPATSTPKPAAPAATPIPEDEEMVYYVQAKGDRVVYEIYRGRRRRVSSGEWEVIKSATAAAGRKLPYSKGKQTRAQVESIPESGK
ncbi:MULTISPECIES: M23 family metallopeptidase [unclassified Microbacterium]|uniref:M23 family metallopeptidase n=1 Tax=unclassified Microbacterium TaxID=2609290 RepID=UPI003865E32F